MVDEGNEILRKPAPPITCTQPSTTPCLVRSSSHTFNAIYKSDLSANTFIMGLSKFIYFELTGDWLHRQEGRSPMESSLGGNSVNDDKRRRMRGSSRPQQRSIKPISYLYRIFLSTFLIFSVINQSIYFNLPHLLEPDFPVDETPRQPRRLGLNELDLVSSPVTIADGLLSLPFFSMSPSFERVSYSACFTSLLAIASINTKLPPILFPILFPHLHHN
ncbi:hypothetical protein BJ165DRAFT_760331 [Panaeolus papilionaceus]|nr:hypothetical protein BJ165DRAFT_760331 [Panaeolus papilionaceus]